MKGLGHSILVLVAILVAIALGASCDSAPPGQLLDPPPDGEGIQLTTGAFQRSKNGKEPCAKSVNWADWPLIANNQNNGSFDWTYPEGVGNPLQPDEWIMLQTHYVNASTQKTPGTAHVDVNLWMMKPE